MRQLLAAALVLLVPFTATAQDSPAEAPPSQAGSSDQPTGGSDDASATGKEKKDAHADAQKADEKKEPAQSSAAGTPASSGVPKNREVPKDPKGIQGISPFWEAIGEGDRAYIARDLDAAIAAYREAITKEPRKPIGHLRIGEAHRAKENMEAAEDAFQSALRFSGDAPAMAARAQFLLADLRERQNQLNEAKIAWQQYAQRATQEHGHPATATERIQRIEQWQQMVEDYSAVKERIEKRLAEAEENSAQKNSGKE